MIKLGIVLPIRPDTDVDTRAWVSRASALFQELFKDKLMLYLVDGSSTGKAALLLNLKASDPEETHIET